MTSIGPVGLSAPPPDPHPEVSVAPTEPMWDPIADRMQRDSLRRRGERLIEFSPPPERPFTAAAVIEAHSRDGESAAATALARREVARAQDDARVAPAALTALLLAAAEAFVTAGEGRASLPCALRALGYARSLDDPIARLRAASLLALSRMLDGDYTQGTADAAQAEKVLETVENPPPWSYLPLLLAHVLEASSRLDAAALMSLSERIRGAYPADPIWRSTAVTTEAMARLVRGEAAQVSAILTPVIAGDPSEVLAMARGFALGILADAQLAAGEARRTLTLLAGHESPAGHALCFDMQRAAAYLQLGEPRAALLTTDACAHMGPRHCVRTIPPILLRRAAAYLRLNDERRATDAFTEAAHLLLASNSATPLLTLARADLDRLVILAAERDAELAARLPQLTARFGLLPTVDAGRSALPKLTPREGVLARHLRDGDPLAEIGRKQHVTVNTVRSQAKSLYRKLEVNSRDDAVAVLERAGYFD